ncbi:MAG: mechanosensitive ion channel family protein [Pararhizobium sp.]
MAAARPALPPRLTTLVRVLVAIVLVCLCVAGGARLAGAATGFGPFQASSSSKPKSGLDQLIDKARQSGATVVIIDPPGSATSSDASGGMMSMMHTNKMLLQGRNNFARMIRNASNFPEIIAATLKKASPDGTWHWLGVAVATALCGILLGLGIYKLITGYLRRAFASRRVDGIVTRAQKLRYLLTRAFLLFMSSVVMFALTVIVAVIFDTGNDATRITIINIVVAYATYRILRYVIFFNFFAPDLDAYRMIHLDGVRARKLYRDWYWVIGFAVIVMGLCQWFHDLGVGRDLHAVMFIAGSGLCALVIAGLTIRHRRDLVEIVRGNLRRGGRRRFRESLARALVPLIVLYLAVAWVVSSFRLTLGLPGGYFLVAAPIIVFIGAIFVYGVAIYVIDVVYERREMAFRRRRVLKRLKERREAHHVALAAAQGAAPVPLHAVDGPVAETAAVADDEEMIVYRPKKSDLDGEYRPVFKRFFEGVVAAFVITVAIGEIGHLWGFDVGRPGHPLARLLDTGFVLFVGLLALQAVNEYINAKIIEEGGSLSDTPALPGEGDSEGGGATQSRLATLLPIFRAMIIGIMGIVGFAIVLSNLGVDIAPLFAGAGVVGIAIGFGAQTLIRDVFSGLFFLIDDAFRRGEYIEVGDVQGVIEKISVRSFQLRHHRGALHTVPFGEIKHLTNYSRDWVLMKLPLRVTYDTDVEKVRRLIKRLGQDLLSHPEVGKLFLQPLKSQGVYAMEDSAMIIRVKFMTRPGDQFVTRKVVYASIGELFAREGIRFAHREVTVRLADGSPSVASLTPEQREAIAGSVRATLDREEEEAYRQGAAMAASDR